MERGIIPVNTIDKTNTGLAGSMSISDNHVPDFLDGKARIDGLVFQQQVVNSVKTDPDGPMYDIPFLRAGVDYDMGSTWIIFQLPHEGIGNLNREIEIRKGLKILFGMNEVQNIGMTN
jgi:hypothetical protein